MRDPTCVMYEAPVLAAGAFVRACQATATDISTFSAEWTSDSDDAEERRMPWTDVFDVDQHEADEVCNAISQDVYAFHTAAPPQQPSQS